MHQPEGAEKRFLESVINFRLRERVLTAQRSHHTSVALVDPGKGLVRGCAKGWLSPRVEDDPNVRGVIGHSGRNGRRGLVVSGRLAHSMVVPITGRGGPRTRKSGNGVRQSDTA